jgi:hypothetical protein
MLTTICQCLLAICDHWRKYINLISSSFFLSLYIQMVCVLCFRLRICKWRVCEATSLRDNDIRISWGWTEKLKWGLIVVTWLF